MTFLRDIVSVAPRFARAINLERDATSDAGLHGYVITSTAQSMLRRLARAYGETGRHRAWTLTGPYGSGKSAFVLFLAALVRSGSTGAGRLARRMLSSQCPELFEEQDVRRLVKGADYVPVLVSGSPGSLVTAVVNAVVRHTQPLYGVGRRPDAYSRLEELSRAGSVSPQAAVQAIVQLSQKLRAAGKAAGLVLIIDELGKFLEFAAHRGQPEDVFLLQELAESTAIGDRPSLMLVTILHQAFENYATDLSKRDREEWAKIQGRFEDVVFQEPPDQIVNLVGQAITHSDDATAIRKVARRHVERAQELGLLPPRAAFDAVRAFVECAPLHPLAVIALARLCRKFGQNQRSLFSFLTSHEPHGFSAFLERPVAKPSDVVYRLPDLYDYAVEAFGSALAVGEGGVRWAEAQNAVARADRYEPAQVAILKSIGLISAVGSDARFKASLKVLQFAQAASPPDTDASLKHFVKKSVLVERKHSETFALWEGSDVDLDERLQEAFRRLPKVGALAHRANQQWRPRPLVAKRHAFVTGTQRHFDVVFADAASLGDIIDRENAADGLLVFTLPANAAERVQLEELAVNGAPRERDDIIVAIPKVADGFLQASRLLEALRWVRDHTPQLQTDAVARRELRSRSVLAESAVLREVQSLFSPGQPGSDATTWYHRGLRRNLPTGRAMSEFLSDVCDQVYRCTPVLRNEIINRRDLSSAAAAARRDLIDAMIRRSGVPRLGINGTPPEMSIYASLLGSTGIHREGGGFGPPQHNPGLRAVWDAIEAFFDHAEASRQPIRSLFDLLQRPPFGVRAGVLPILLCAALLARETDVALYEDGAFLPELTVEAFERLLRSPEKFSLRRYRVDGIRREVFQQIAGFFEGRAEPTDRLADVVRPLYRMLSKLPPYARTTSSLTASTLAVRDALLSAREPDALLFVALPEACGFRPLSPTETAPADSDAFVRALRHSLIELQQAYEALRDHVRQLLLRAFELGNGELTTLRDRSAALIPHCVEARLRAFVHQAADAALEDSQWVEAVASALVGKPPRTWSDTDRARFEVALAEVSRAFRHLESLVFAEIRESRHHKAAVQVFRIGVSDRHRGDYERVVSVNPADQDCLAETVQRIQEVLKSTQTDSRPQLALSALAMVCRELLAEDPPAPTTLRTSSEVTNVS